MNRSATALRIERMSYGAEGIAHTAAGKTVFVRGAVVGDLVDVQLMQEGASFARATATQLLEPSPYRVTSPCPYAAQCGGCPWACLSRDMQLVAKRENVISSLTRIGHFSRDEAERLVAPCEAPSTAWGYRNKIELSIMRTDGRLSVGMHPAEGVSQRDDDASVATHSSVGSGALAAGNSSCADSPLVKVNSCPLLDKQHASLVKSVSGALGYLGGRSDLALDRVGIRVATHTHDCEIALWGSPGSFPRARVAQVIKEATHASSIVRVLTKGSRKARRVTGVEVLSGKGFWNERIAGATMSLSAPSFFQVNTLGAERLVQLVLEGLSPTPQDGAMDLYCGAGTFTLPLARQCASVSAVEASGSAVRDLRRNLLRNQIDTVEVIGRDAGREFPDTDADVIVVDPPRAGLADAVIKKLSSQPARAIAYVSCDPATLARDLARFRAQGVFTPTRITPVDLFPQTYHVETVVLMSRIEGK